MDGPGFHVETDVLEAAAAGIAGSVADQERSPDPGAVRANAQTLRDRAGRAERAGDGLADIDTGAWTGPAAGAFRDRFSYEPNKWYGAANALHTAADALTTFAHALEWAQGRAGEAIRQWDAAEAESDRARRAYRELADRAPAGQAVPPFTDTGAAGRQAAVDTLRIARDQVAAAPAGRDWVWRSTPPESARSPAFRSTPSRPPGWSPEPESPARPPPR